VDVIKLITKGTIEEDMLRLGQTKLALDEAVAGDAEESEESEAARQMKIGLMNSLRQHFVDDDDVKEGDVTTTVDGKEGV
jgi:SWI/SNF-related matrix-associated actin-dependent regulator 1 of chromatin subfamily A